MSVRDRIDMLIKVIGLREFQADMKRAEHSIKELNQESQRSYRQSIVSMTRFTSIVGSAGLVSGLGVIGSSLSASAAGAVALSSSMAPLGGLAVAGANGMAAFGVASALVNTSFFGMKKSLKEVIDQFRDGPAVGRFKDYLQGVIPVVMKLRNATQDRIIGGVISGLKEAQPLIRRFSPALLQMSTVLGGLAARAGGLANSMGGPLNRILQSNVTVTRNFGNAGLNMAVVLVRLMDAARPLTEWLSRLALAWSHSALSATRAGTASGSMARFFDRTRAVLQRVLSIGKSLAQTLLAVMRAATPTGNSLLKTLDLAARGMARWTQSTRGQNRMRRYFEDIKPTVLELGRLVRDLAGIFIRMGDDKHVAPLLRTLRTDLLPVLDRLLTSGTAAFGPAIISMITNFARVFEAGGGAIAVYVSIMSTLLGAFAWLLTNVPGARVVFIALAVAWTALGLATRAYATGVKMAGIYTALFKAEAGAATLATRLMGGAMRALPIFALVALGIAIYMAYKKVGWFHNAVQAVWKWVKGAWGSIKGFLTGPVASAASYIWGRFTAIVGWVAKLPGRIANAAKGLWDGLKSGLSAVINWIKTALADMIGGVLSVVKTAADAINAISPGNPIDTSGLTTQGLTNDFGPLNTKQDFGSGAGLPSTRSRARPAPKKLAHALGSSPEFHVKTAVYLDRKKIADAVGQHVGERVNRK